MKLKCAETICKDCNYKAITWHKDLDIPLRCGKCNGLLKIIMRQI